MLHLSNLFLFVSFTIALAGVFVAETYRKTSRLPVFASFRNYYLTLAFLILVNFLYGYQEAAVLSRSFPEAFSPYLRFMLLLVFLCIPVYTWYMAQFQLHLINKKMPGGFRLSFLITVGILYGTYLFNMIFDVIRPATPFPMLFEIAANHLSLFVLLPVSLYVAVYAKKNCKKQFRKPILVIQAVFVLMFLFILVIMLSFNMKWISRRDSLMGFSMAWSVINITPLFHFRRIGDFLKGFDTGKDPEKTLALLNKEYDITSREYKIITLISSGRTNKEISEILFIGLQTVKDHNSRIFKKMRVDNRIQLINKLRGL